MDSNNYNFRSILSSFNLNEDVAEIFPFGSGHINGTYYVKNASPKSNDYILQRINNYVFPDVPALTENIKLVTEHLRKKFTQNGWLGEMEVLTLVPTTHGTYFYQDTEGNYWRMFYYLKDTKTYDVVRNEHQACQGGKAFGIFQYMLTDLDARKLVEVIPDFHNIQFRLSQFKEALEKNSADRIKDCKEEIDFINARVNKMNTILSMAQDGKLPLRITHNDTKFNNVLLNANDEAYCVIDLDTVMPGYVAYDFGDAMRTILNAASEDEADLSKITLNIHLFKAYTKGYLNEALKFLTNHEIDSLIFGVLLLPYMQATRFLTDYINGDIYYKVDFSEHNLQRTRAQIQLVKKIEESESQLNSIIMQTAAEFKQAV